ncbi:MAG: arylamine N-acetyltransferase [Chthoniobacterales bacterium]
MTEAPEFTFPLDRYLERVGYRGSREPTAETLCALHRAQVFSIPFENLDPLTGRAVRIDQESLVAKMVHHRRGGYCFELNGLFVLALRAFGYSIRSLAARVMIKPGHFAPRTHQITLVEIDGQRWIADVGFGGNGLLEPLVFDLDKETEQTFDRFRFVTDDVYGYRLEHALGNHWRVLYAFSLDLFLPSDYQVMNFFTSKSSDSMFTHTALCSMATADKRFLFFGNELKIRGISEKTVMEIKTAEKFREVLAKYFGIDWPLQDALPDPRPAPPGAREI